MFDVFWGLHFSGEKTIKGEYGEFAKETRLAC